MLVSGARIASFRRYVHTRRYHQGRGSKAGWAFIAHALGDPHLPNAASWNELRAYLLAGGAEAPIVAAAHTVWRSYLSHISKERRSIGNNPARRADSISFEAELSGTFPRAHPCATSNEQ
jgi:hypothetical protein